MQSVNAPRIDDHRSFYQGLHHTGIDYYFTKDRQGLQSHRPVVCAACLVVLEHDPKHLTASQRTLLEGMLKVLDLGKNDYCLAWMMPRADTETDPYSRESSILKYAPYSVLFLGSAFKYHPIPAPLIPANAGIQFLYTYSPQELEVDPKLKRSAFDTLLALKQHIFLLGSPVGAGLCAGPVPPSPGS